MDISIISKKEAPLLNRTEVSAAVGHESSTPNRQDVRKAAARALSVDEKLVVVESIIPSYGAKSARLTLHVYKDEGSVKKTELPHMLKRMEGKKKEAEGQ